MPLGVVRAALRSRSIERLCIHGGGAVRIIHPELEDRRGTGQRVDLCVTIGRRVSERPERLSESPIVAGTAEQSLERGHRRRVPWRPHERLVVGLDRGIDPAELLFGDACDAKEALDHVLRARREIEQPALSVHDAFVTTLLRVDAHDRSRGGLVPRLATEHELVHGERAARILHAKLERRADAMHGRDLVCARQHRGLGLEHLDVLGPLSGVRESARERHEGPEAIFERGPSGASGAHR